MKTRTAEGAPLTLQPRQRPRYTPASFLGAIFSCARVPLLLIALSSLQVVDAAVPASSGASLLARYTSLADRLQKNPFQRPLVLDSTESANDTQGEIFAVLDYRFPLVSAALDDPREWCDVLSLHINTKYCQAEPDDTRTTLRVGMGRKLSQPPEDAYPLEFAYRVVAANPKYLEIQLSAEQGPMGTRNYRIQLQAIPLDQGRTFIHLTYFFAYGWTGRVAMKTYFATLGRDKVGFTVTRRRSNGQPEYIQGMRGLVERNSMRYYLAIDAYLDARTAAPAQQLQQRLQTWFSATEQYSRQLHEIDRAAYIEMKLSEDVRRNTLH